MKAKNQTPYLLLYCRARYERDCAAEIQWRAEQLEIHGYCKTQENNAFVQFFCNEPDACHKLVDALNFKQLIFCRQWFVVDTELELESDGDRLQQLKSVLSERDDDQALLVWEVPDSDATNPLQRLINSLDKINRQHDALKLRFTTDSKQSLHICFLNSYYCAIGRSPIANSAVSPAGLMRLKLPKQAPSRSMLKLDEALKTFLSPSQRKRLLHSGMTAVDLGAAPGGWTYVLVREGLTVTSIDNGPLDQALLESGQVSHLRVDAFKYQPDNPVDWLVADIADKPMRVLELIQHWIANNWARHIIFILKLPMAKRQRFIQDNVWPVLEAILSEYRDLSLLAKHLSHDRHEITVAFIRKTN